MNDTDKINQRLIEELKPLQTLMDCLPDQIYVKDTKGRFIFCNKAVVEITQFKTPAELIGKTDFDICPPENARSFHDEEQQIIKTGVPLVNHEQVIANPTGQTFWSLVTKMPWRDSSGSIIGIIGSNRNITEHKKAQLALLESEARYKAIFDSAREGILVADAETKQFRYANPAICKMFGYSEEQFCRMSVLDIHPKEHLAEVIRDFEAMVLGEKKTLRNVPCLRGDSSIFYADINATTVVINNKSYLAGFFSDVTQHRQAEEALRESEARYKAIFNFATEGIIVADIETKRLRYVNPAVCRMFGYAPEEMQNLTVYDVHPKELMVSVLSGFEAQARGEKTLLPNVPCLHKDGAVFYADINTTSVVIDQRRCNVGLFTDTTRRRQAEEALRESEQRYRLLVEQLPAITYTAALDEASTTLYVSPQVQQMLGVSPADYKADPDLWRELLHPDDRDRVLAELTTSHQTGQPFESEYRMTAKGGRVIWTRDNARTVKDDSGKPLYLQGIMYDITASKQTEEALRQSEENFRGIAERNFDMIFMTDAASIITYLSPASERIFGYKSEEMVGKHFSNLLVESEIPKAMEHFTEKLKGHDYGNFHHEAKKKDGSSVFIEVNASQLVKDGIVQGTQGIIRDVTERKKAEKELQKAHDELENRVRQRTADLAKAVEKLEKEIAERKNAEQSLLQAEERFRTIFENTVVGLYRTTPDGRILLANPALVKMMGYESFEELAKVNLEKEGLDPSTPRWLFKQRIEKEGRVIGLESVWMKKDGSRLFVSESAFAFKDDKGNILYYEGTAQNITKRKEAEEELLGYQKQLRSLASELSLAEERLRRKIAIDLHDNISQNLAISKMKLESAAADPNNPDLAASLGEVANLIGQTIEATRSLTFEMSPPVLYELGFEAAIGWLANQTRQRFGIETEFINDRKHKPLDNDVRIVLFQAVRELLANVVKHSKADRVKISIQAAQGLIRITVEDNGVGFDVSRTGTGFGLFNIRERLDHIGGGIELSSKPGLGTKITLFAPLLKTKNKNRKSKPLKKKERKK